MRLIKQSKRRRVDTVVADIRHPSIWYCYDAINHELALRVENDDHRFRLTLNHDEARTLKNFLDRVTLDRDRPRELFSNSKG